MKKNIKSLKNNECILDAAGYELVRLHIQLTVNQQRWIKGHAERINISINAFMRAFIDRYQLVYEQEQVEKKKYGSLHDAMSS